MAFRAGRVHNSTNAKDGNFYGTAKFSLVKLGFRNGLPKIASAVFLAVFLPWAGFWSFFINLTTFHGAGIIIMFFPPVAITYLILNSRNERDKVSTLDAIRFRYQHYQQPKYLAGNTPYERGVTHYTTEFTTPRRLYQNH